VPLQEYVAFKEEISLDLEQRKIALSMHLQNAREILLAYLHDFILWLSVGLYRCSATTV